MVGDALQSVIDALQVLRTQQPRPALATPGGRMTTIRPPGQKLPGAATR